MSIPWYERWNLDIQEFSAAGIRTFAVVEGRPDAFPVIFLHGLPGGAFIWAGIIKELGRGRLAIAPDLPGWGRSFTRFAKTAQDLSREGVNRWLEGLLTAQRIQRFDLVAHGSGVWPALELLMADTSRVRRLAFVSPEISESGQTNLIKRMFGGGKWSQKRIARWLADHAALTDNAWEEFQTDLENLLGSETNARTSVPLSEAEFRARIPEYKTALAAYKGAELFIQGKNDPQASELVEAMPGAEVHRIENAGHFPMLDAPEEVAALMKDFLGE